MITIKIISENGERVLVEVSNTSASLTFETGKFTPLWYIVEEFESTIANSLLMEEH